MIKPYNKEELLEIAKNESVSVRSIIEVEPVLLLDGVPINKERKYIVHTIEVIQELGDNYD